MSSQPAAYPTLVYGQKITLSRGRKYSVYAPAPDVVNNQFTGNSIGTTVVLHRINGIIILHDVFYGSVSVIDGDIYDSIEMQNDVPVTLLIYEGIIHTKQTTLASSPGDIFYESVPATTALVDRSAVQTPMNAGIPMIMAFSLSVQGDNPTTTGGYYIAIRNNASKGREIFCSSGTVAGQIVTNGSQSWYIEYVNPDSVAHFMSANFTFYYGRWV